MSTKQVFCFYIIASLFAANYYTSGYSDETLFGYGLLVDPDSLTSATNFLLVGLGAFLSGAYVTSPIFKKTVDVKLLTDIGSAPDRQSRSLPQWQTMSVVAIVAIYVFLFTSAYAERGFSEDLTERVFENKLAPFFMVMLAYFGYTASLHRNTLLLRGVIFALSLCVTVIDASRSGLIPLLGLLVGSVVAKRHISALLFAYAFFFGASYSITGRLLDDRFSFEVLNAYLFPDIELVMEAIKFIFDYAFAFSILNFSYMAFISVPEFTWVQLLTSINPLPSYFLDPFVIDSLRFEDRTRAIGGPAELLLVGPAVFLAGFFVLGVFSAYVDTIVKSRFRFIVLLMFLLATIIFFQYSLRTSARMFTVIMLVTFLLRYWVRSNNRRRIASQRLVRPPADARNVG